MQLSFDGRLHESASFQGTSIFISVNFLFLSHEAVFGLAVFYSCHYNCIAWGQFLVFSCIICMPYDFAMLQKQCFFFLMVCVLAFAGCFFFQPLIISGTRIDLVVCFTSYLS